MKPNKVRLKTQVRQIIDVMMASTDCSRAELARLLKVSRPTVTVMLRNAQNFKLDTLEAVADKLGFDVVVTATRRRPFKVRGLTHAELARHAKKMGLLK